MKTNVAGLLVLAVSLCAGPGWAEGSRQSRGRGSDYTSRSHSDYRSREHHEQRYAHPGSRVNNQPYYRAPMPPSRCEPVWVACPPRQVWQPGYWVMQDMGCGRYGQVWQPGRYIAIGSPGFTYVSSW